jgi:hypothetical protein
MKHIRMPTGFCRRREYRLGRCDGIGLSIAAAGSDGAGARSGHMYVGDESDSTIKSFDAFPGRRSTAQTAPLSLIIAAACAGPWGC